MKRVAGVALVLVCAALGFGQSSDRQAVPPMKYDKANAIVKFDCTMVKVNADGTGEELNHYRIALLSDRAIRFISPRHSDDGGIKGGREAGLSS